MRYYLSFNPKAVSPLPLNQILSVIIFCVILFPGEGAEVSVRDGANHGLLDEEGHEIALGSSSDPERSSLSGGVRDCDSDVSEAGNETNSSPGHPTASSLFIKRSVDEVKLI